MSKEWFFWEVFICSQYGLVYKYVGSLYVFDGEMVINNVCDVYICCNEGVGIWVVCVVDIVFFSFGDKVLLFELVNSKVYCYLIFFFMLVELKNL